MEWTTKITSDCQDMHLWYRKLLNRAICRLGKIIQWGEKHEIQQLRKLHSLGNKRQQYYFVGCLSRVRKVQVYILCQWVINNLMLIHTWFQVHNVRQWEWHGPCVGNSGKWSYSVKVACLKSFMCQIFTKYVFDGICRKKCGVLASSKVIDQN